MSERLSQRDGTGFRSSTIALVLIVAGMVSAVPGTGRAMDVSPPAFLQWFESSYETIINRTPDLFTAGYGAVWTPPPGRGDTSDFSVGYDVYDRFDLGQWDKKTLYGTETGIRQMADVLHRAAVDLHVDFIPNHNGYSGTGDAAERAAFLASGGYPGFFFEYGGDLDGDFHSAFDGGDINGRLAGLIDIAQEKNYPAVRNPVPGYANNLPAGTVPQYGRLANVPQESNRRFYPDQGHNTIYVFDPLTGEGDIPIHQFNLPDPMAGDPVEENGMGYLMRNAQWLVQVIGVDGLRLDAAKHYETWVLGYLDRAVYCQNPRLLLDGSVKHVFSYGEVYDGDAGMLLSRVRKDINPAEPGRVGGNRDVLDYKTYFALKDNLEHTGTADAWYHVRDADLDLADDGIHNGSVGVKFVHNHDVFQPYELSDVAHAYVLMMPGNAVVYFNGKQFGDEREFPKEGRGDALSVAGGSSLTRILDARNSHGRGDYAERWIDDQGLYVFERLSSAVVGLSNRGDWGFDTRSVEVGFAPGTHLIELSGNAADANVDPHNDISEVLTVFDDNGTPKIDVRVPRNRNANGDWHGRGFVIYGLSGPQSDAGLELSDVDSILPGDTSPANDYENGVNRRTDLHVIKTDSFQARLLTHEVRLLGLESLRDVHADGDKALLKLDGGRDVNGNGYVDFTVPGDVSYGFEWFTDKSSPLIGPGGIGGPRGDGEFLQTIDATALAEGVHFLEAVAYRHRTDGGPAISSSFKKAIYVDRLPPNSGIQELRAVGSPGDTDVLVESLDDTADGVHVFLNLPETVIEAQIYQMATQGQGTADRVDVDLFKKYFAGIGSGNNVFTLVSFEVTGTSNIQRLVGQWVDGRGAGLGDLNHDGLRNPDDLAGTGYGFEHVLYEQNAEFNPAGDVNADGRVDNFDLFALGDVLANAGAPQQTLDTCQAMLLRRGDFNSDSVTNQWDVDELYRRFGSTDWFDDLSVDGATDQDDVDLLVHTILGTEYGDTNLDGNVDYDDYTTARGNFGQTQGMLWIHGDTDGDGDVDLTDYVTIKVNFGFTSSQGKALAGDAPTAGVPEPSTIALLATAAITVLLLRRRNSGTGGPFA